MILSILSRISWLRIGAVLVVLAVVSASIWGVYSAGVREGREDVQSQWNLAKAKQAESDLKLEIDTRAREQALQTSADTLRKTKDEQLQKISTDLRDALAANSLLRNARPPEYTPAPTGTGPLCSGTSLYAEDADFLSREASRADGLRAAYLYCEAQYGKALDAVNGKSP